MKNKYSIFSLIKNAFSYHENWEKAWKDPAPKKEYDAVIIGGGGHGLATAYYLAKKHDKKNIAVRTGHHCCQPLMKFYNISGTTRVSFGVYNTIEDVDYLIESIDEVIKVLQ